MVATYLKTSATETSDREPRRTDEELLQAYCQTGNRDLFSELVHRYEGELFAFLRRYLNQSEMAEDAFQGTFLQVHLNCKKFDPKRSFRTWLYSIAMNQAIDLQRRNKRHRVQSLDREGGRADEESAGKLADLLVSSEPGPVGEVSAAEQRDWVRSAMAKLPEPFRQTVFLIYFQGLSYIEAAEVMAVPVGTAKSRIHAAVARLTEMWNEREARQRN